jgi:hypothetical protein
MLPNEVLRYLIEEQDSLSYLTLLVRREYRDDETVTNVYVELVSRPPTGCMGVQPSP